MNRTEKEEFIAEYKSKITKAAGVFVADYRGLSVAAVNELRKTFKKANVEYRVVKNTLIKRAIAGTPYEPLAQYFREMSAIAIAQEPVAAAKAALDFKKTNENFKVKGAVVEGQALNAEGVVQLSKLPSQAEMRAQLLGIINAPASKLLAQLNAPGQQLVGVLQAKADKEKETEKV